MQLGYRAPTARRGIPGAVDFAVTFRLEGPRLICEMCGVPDRPTPINLANHSYYNLGGGGTVKDHVLWVDADGYTPTDAELIPTGRSARWRGRRSTSRTSARSATPASTTTSCCAPGRDQQAAGGAGALPADRAWRLELWTDEPGLQLFDASEMTIGTPGHDGQSYGPYAGLCLEAQHFPDSMHQPGLAEHRPHAGEPVLPAAGGGDWKGVRYRAGAMVYGGFLDMEVVWKWGNR